MANPFGNLAGQACPVRLTTAGSEFCVGASNRQRMRDHPPPETVLRSVNSEFECLVIEPRNSWFTGVFRVAVRGTTPTSAMVWKVGLVGVGATSANEQLRFHGNLRGPTSPYDTPDQTG